MAEDGRTAPAARAAPRAAVAAVALVGRTAAAPAAAYAVLTLITAVVPIGVAWLTKALLDRLTGGDGHGAVPVTVGLALLTSLATVTQQLSQYVHGTIQRRVGLRTQDTLGAAVNRQVGLRNVETPGYLDRLELARQTAASPGQVLDGLLQVASSAVTAGGFLIALAALQPLMAVAVAASTVPALGAELHLSRRRVAALRTTSPAQRREYFYQSLFVNASAAKEIRVFGLDAFLRRRLRTERAVADAARRAVDRLDLLVQSLLALLTAGTAGVGLVWAVRDGGLSPGAVVMFVASVSGVQSALRTLVVNVSQVHQAVIGFAQYLAVVDAPADLPVPADPVPAPALRSGIELRGVWFRYGPDRPWVLRGLDLFIPYGSSVALVGLNGAGKSTIVKLLCRFYDPERGEISWDGVDLRDMDPAALRRRIGVVFQDFMSYDMTAAENIGVGDLDRIGDRAAVTAAARRAGAHDSVARLPRGYDTPVSRTFLFGANGGEDAGVTLSGGQWQRVALARALLRDQVDLVVLDEPSSGLDPDAEYAVHATLAEHRAGRTSVLISHRLNTVRDAEQIVVLRDGVVVERGSHDDLLRGDGGYARLFRLQARGYAATEPAGARLRPALPTGGN